MNRRIVQFLIVVLGLTLSGFATECYAGAKSGKVYKRMDGRVQKLELYDQGVKMVYNFDAFALCESAFAYSGESLIAKAERVGMRGGEPGILDFEIAETHFHQKTGEIVYQGKMVFRCKTNAEWGERTKVTPVSGKRPKDLFREWPFALMY